jgi:transposase-like protein
MRHKILDSLGVTMDRGIVSGIVEMDETFVAESFKGNHVKSGFEMPREPRKRGKQVKKRGISSEQICIGTAVDKNGNLIMEMACKGRITSRKLEKLYDGYVEEGSTICTDSLSGYRSLSRKLKLDHKQIPSGKHSDGTFNLSSINSVHSKYKTWMRKFNGVSTKFLPNYLIWFKWVEMVKGMGDTAKPAQMWADIMAKQTDVRIDTIRNRETKWI